MKVFRLNNCPCASSCSAICNVLDFCSVILCPCPFSLFRCWWTEATPGIFLKIVKWKMFDNSQHVFFLKPGPALCISFISPLLIHKFLFGTENAWRTQIGARLLNSRNGCYCCKTNREVWLPSTFSYTWDHLPLFPSLLFQRFAAIFCQMQKVNTGLTTRLPSALWYRDQYSLTLLKKQIRHF